MSYSLKSIKNHFNFDFEQFIVIFAKQNIFFSPKISLYLLWGYPIDICQQKIYLSNEIYHILNLKIKYNSNALQKMLIFKYELWTKSELSMAV